MAIRVVEFSSGGYKIRKIFAQEPKEYPEYVGNFLLEFLINSATMAIPFVEFSREGYKIRKVFG